MTFIAIITNVRVAFSNTEVSIEAFADHCHGRRYYDT
ncbi:hypothetical protein Q427_00215 [Halomonas sp. BC04]|nr:hypothetical protein Q427_00215 [Halomonas sp. BC04]